MGDRKGYYVKPATKCTIPGVAFAVVCVPHIEPARLPESIIEATWDTASVAVSYRRRGKWSGIQSARVSTPEALREWMQARARPGRVNWVITPDVSETLTLSQWWDYAESRGIAFRDAAAYGHDAELGSAVEGGVRIRSIVLGQRCGILDADDRGVRWRFVSARNYWPESGMVDDVQGSGAEVARGECERSGGVREVLEPFGSVALLGRFRSLADWWERIATAPFGRTAGQLAWGVMRSRLRARTLCAHSHDGAQRLERCAAHGGRASVFCVAPVGFRTDSDSAADVDEAHRRYPHVPGPVTQVDVQSMYPALLRDRAYPVKLACVYSPSARELRDLVEGGIGVIADVDITTTRADFPLRQGERVIYPTGSFRTVLAGPDLRALYECGEVRNVHTVSTYDMARPFAEAMGALLQDRADAIARADEAGATFAKLVSNSLGGKFAQRAGGWCRRAKLDGMRQWGEEAIMIQGKERARRIRWICGCAFEWEESKEAHGPHTAVFAYLTAYGRQQMAAILRACPPKTVLSEDTDGAWLLDSALDALRAAGILAEAGPGKLRIKDSGRTARFLSARHYHIDFRWTLSGYSTTEITPDGRNVRHVAARSLLAHRVDSAPRRVVKSVSYPALPVDAGGGIIDALGWVHPPHLEKL